MGWEAARTYLDLETRMVDALVRFGGVAREAAGGLARRFVADQLSDAGVERPRREDD